MIILFENIDYKNIFAISLIEKTRASKELNKRHNY